MTCPEMFLVPQSNFEDSFVPATITRINNYDNVLTKGFLIILLPSSQRVIVYAMFIRIACDKNR